MILGAMFNFEAAHHLPHHEGKCRNLHGHSYRMEVKISGPVDSHFGMVIDLKDFKHLINEQVIDHLDHSNLNEKWDNPTAENMVKSIVNQLKDILHYHVDNTIKLYSVKLWETEKCFVEWRNHACT